jgi:hypothetical protein
MVTYANGNRAATPIPTISGRHLAHAKLSASQRAGIAAAIQLNELRPEQLTAEQVVEMTRANRIYARKARRATPAERRHLIVGSATVGGLPNRSASLLRKKNGNGGWGALSDSELEAAVRQVGVGRVWDAITRIID